MSSVPKADGDVAGIHPVLGASFLHMVKMLLGVSIQPRPDIQILILTSISARSVA